jgi:hypothetical protein
MSNSAKPMIQDQLAIGAPTRTSPKWAATATTKQMSEMIHTTIVGAFPELRMAYFPLI